MSGMALTQLLLYFIVLTALAWPLGAFMARVYRSEPTFISRVLGPVERLLYRLSGVEAEDDMGWRRYAVAVLLFNLLGALVVYALQRLQGYLPLNPQEFGAVTPDSSFNTAVSFATNTNWQGYGGESTMSYLTQMLGLNVQNFVSAATGMAVLVAFIRGLVRRQANAIGNFWVDLTRSTLYVLLPLALLLSLAAGVARRGAELRQGGRSAADAVRRSGHTGQGRRAGEEGNDHDAVAAAGAGCVAGGDQAARHQRRWILQRQLGASLREPDAVLELPRGDRDSADTGGAVLHVRAVGQRSAPGLGNLCRDERDIPAADRWRDGRRGNTESARDRARCRDRRRQHGRQGDAPRRADLRAVGDGDDFRVERLGQLDARLVHAARGSGADVADPARRGGLSAASARGCTACWSSRSSRCSSPG